MRPINSAQLTDITYITRHGPLHAFEKNMALRMDSGLHSAPSHHRTALPKRTPRLGGGGATAPSAVRTAPVPRTRPPQGAQRNRSETSRGKGSASAASAVAGSAISSSVGATTAVASAAGASADGSGGGAKGGGGGGGGTAKGASTIRDNAPKKAVVHGARGASGGERRSGIGAGGGGGGASVSHSSARKRVRVVDEKLGEFVVFLTPYKGDHNDVCERCDAGGDLLCCDFCNLVYHLRCVTPKLTELPDQELWLCPACTTEVTNRQLTKRRRLDDGGRAISPAPASARAGQPPEKLPSFHGVKAENDAFRAFVLYKNQTVDIGLYPTAQAAARAYDRKALSLFGDAAVCNFPADEQVEVEGVGADGITVKGVVRSFHQWRAEMQWGNKKRHLGFFDRLDHAAFAYNRAALYMNGPETALNPTKEGYVPPKPAGAPVRVPRNKLFVQQLPVPFSARTQTESGVRGAEHARRRYQMAGKYHLPSVGPDHQVLYVPLLPPPSRPWRGHPPTSQPRKRPRACPPQRPSTPSLPVPETFSETSMAAPAEKVSLERTATDVADDSPRLIPLVVNSSPCQMVAQRLSDTCKVVARCSAPPQAQPNPCDICEAKESCSDGEGRPVRRANGRLFESRGESVAETVSKGVDDLNVHVDGVWSGGPLTIEAATANEVLAAMEASPHASQARGIIISGVSTPTAAEPRLIEARDADVGADPKDDSLRPLPWVSTSGEAPSGSGFVHSRRRPRGNNSVGDKQKDSKFWREGVLVAAGKEGPTPEFRESPAQLGESGRDLNTSTIREKVSCWKHSPMTGENASSAPPGTARRITVRDPVAVASLKRQILNQPLPPREPSSSAASHERCEASCGGEVDKGEVANGADLGALSTDTAEKQVHSNEVAPPVSTGPVPPSVSFDEVAELVWDPRAGPKPRGVIDTGDEDLNRRAIERAMWDRDGMLLERVAPAHAEKAMQVLQMHRHDVERAAQMLSVRHGIHVIGLSSVRTTRNSRAEQQAANAAKPGEPIGPRLAWRGGGGGGGGGGGTASTHVGASSGSHIGSSSYNSGTPSGGWNVTTGGATAARALGKRTDAQGITREEAKLAGDAFMRYGRDLNAVAKMLGWKKNRVVEYYYCVWKFSPAYQVWKATRHQAGLPGVGSAAGGGSGSSGATSPAGASGSGLQNATSDGMRWRGSRLRTLKTGSSS